MSTISPAEASALARVAENPGISADRLARMLLNASEDVKQIAQAIIEVAGRLGDVNSFIPANDTESAAFEMIKWARRNRDQRAAFRKAV
jgi:hypothetical protein